MLKISEILEKLENVREYGQGHVDDWTARCPAHEDKRNSLGVTIKNGRILFCCWAGCTQQQIKSAIGLVSTAVAGTTRRVEPHTCQIFSAAYYAPLSLKNMQLTHEWQYQHADGSQAFLVYRLIGADGKKEIRPVTPCEKGWRFGLPPSPRPIYRLPEIVLTDGLVVVCEGEKSTDAVALAGWTATTSCGGASGAHRSDWSRLADRSVAIWPDNDEPGLKYASDVKEILEPLGCKVAILKPVGEKGDDAADCKNITETIFSGERIYG